MKPGQNPKHEGKVDDVREGVLVFLLLEVGSQEGAVGVDASDEEKSDVQVGEEAQDGVIAIGDEEEKEVADAEEQRRLDGVVPVKNGGNCAIKQNPDEQPLRD